MEGYILIVLQILITGLILEKEAGLQRAVRLLWQQVLFS